MTKVLVIDDEESILEGIKFILELENYEVLTFSNSNEALSVFKKDCENIDVVVTDMKMPYPSGLDVLKEVKKVMPEMSVIILTGHGDMENAILAMKEGAFEYLKKPVLAHDLTIAINKAVNSKNLLLENKRIQQELLDHKNYLQSLNDSAEKILMNMLPKKLPDIEGYDFHVMYKACDVVGGDMYDVSDIGDYVCFYVFDVSSHGILASVISTIIKSFLQNIKYNYIQGINKRRFPEIVMDLNVEMLSNTAQNIFASLFLGFIDKKSNILYTVSAGHITQYIIRKDNTTIPLESTGTLLGVFSDSTYSCSVNKIIPGDKIWLFTDGIVEASSNESIFGMENIQNIINKCTNLSLKNTINNILTSVKDFSNSEFCDDITILGIEVK